MSEIGRGLNQGVTRRELLIELLLGLIILAGVSFFIAAHVTPFDRTASIGVIGATGAKGDKGDQGLQGLQGLIGLSGNDGATGATGATGANGATGATGAMGAAGAAGANGTNGTNGSDGSQGAPGAPGSLSGDYASYFASTSDTTAIPQYANWILSFPNQATQHGSNITVDGSAINVAQNGTYLITSTGTVQMPDYEVGDLFLYFSMSLEESDNGGSSSPLVPDPLADYESIGPSEVGTNELTQTYSISRLVTVTNAPSTFDIRLHNNSQGGTGIVYAYNQVVNILKVD